MKILFPLLFVLIICLAVFSCVAMNIAQEKEAEDFYNELLASKNYEIPLCAGDDFPNRKKNSRAAKESPHQIVRHKGYTLCYRENYEQAEWVAYTLDAEKLQKNAERSGNFRADSAVRTGSAEIDDYRKSGFDRGHLAPAADMSYSAETMSESFFLSNVSPQNHSFNSGIWNDLEKYLRRLSAKHERVYIVTGPLLEKKSYETIGGNKVAVPEYFYKAALVEDSREDGGSDFFMLAWIIPNEGTGDSFWNYRVAVDEIEKRSGIDLFFLLDDETENALEAKK